MGPSTEQNRLTLYPSLAAAKELQSTFVRSVDQMGKWVQVAAVDDCVADTFVMEPDGKTDDGCGFLSLTRAERSLLLVYGCDATVARRFSPPPRRGKFALIDFNAALLPERSACVILSMFTFSIFTNFMWM